VHLRHQPPSPSSTRSWLAPWLLALLVVVAGCQPQNPLSSTATVDATPPPEATVTAPQSATPAAPITEAMIAEPIVPALVIEGVTPLKPGEQAEEMALSPTFALPPGPISVGLLLPLSGPSAELGQALFDAAQLALFDVGNQDVVLLPRDTGGTPEGAAEAAGQALEGGARLLVGPLFSASVAAVTPLARAAGVNVIAFSSDRAVARPGVYIMGFLPAQQVDRVVGFAAGRGLNWFTALAPSSIYGETMVRAVTAATRRQGVLLVDPVFYPSEVRAASDVEGIVRFMANYDVRRAAMLSERDRLMAIDSDASRAALAALQDVGTLGATGFEAVLLPEGGAKLLTIAPLFPYFDMNRPQVRLLGTNQWETANLASEPALYGGWYAASPPAARAGFEIRFKDTFGYAPPRLATLAYDAVALAGALARLPDGRGFTAETLTSAGGFRGVDGIIRFTADGGNQRGLAVLEVTAEGPVVVGEAPDSFAGF
jgi:branched-chain amino acid transport system substrate-binding protein